MVQDSEGGRGHFDLDDQTKLTCTLFDQLCPGPSIISFNASGRRWDLS